MNIHFTQPHSFTVSDFDNDDFNITGDKPVYQLTALATFVLSLARCTFAVLWVYGDRSDADPDTIEMTMNWSFDHDPTRFKQIEMNIFWPALPEKKLKVAQKMSEQCTIHHTIHDCVDIVAKVRIN
ncbi:MAG: OsmC family protein [Arenicellales bacterium]